MIASPHILSKQGFSSTSLETGGKCSLFCAFQKRNYRNEGKLNTFRRYFVVLGLSLLKKIWMFTISQNYFLKVVLYFSIWSICVLKSQSPGLGWSLNKQKVSFWFLYHRDTNGIFHIKKYEYLIFSKGSCHTFCFFFFLFFFFNHDRRHSEVVA